MSAIGAIFSPEGVQGEEIEAMRAALAMVPHDASQHWASGPIGLSACTLHTNAQSREQKQPYVSADGKRAAVFDGYLLNPQELIEDVTAKGFAPRNNSDVAIALAAYEAWGRNCANRLEGEYALIIADMGAGSGQGRLFAARDHMGFVPLYYREDAGRLIIASDFRTLAALSNAPLTPNPLYLAQIMTNKWYLREDTTWKEAKRLVRAHTLSYDGQQITTDRYWSPPTDITIRYKSDEEYIEHYKEVLFDCVKRASRSDMPIGIAVSGGLDSSALFVIGDKLEQDGQWQAPGLMGYSLAGKEGTKAFELPYARAVASHVGRELSEVPLFDPDLDWYEADANWHHDLAIPSNGAMMYGMEKRVVDDGGRVILNGIGGDEWLTGNVLDYREYWQDKDVSGFKRALSHDIADFGWGKALSMSMRQIIGELTPEFVRAPFRARMRAKARENDPALAFLAPELRQALAHAEERYESELPVEALAWTKHNLVTSPFSDLSHSMMRRQRSRIGVESRHPMLARRFIEFSLRSPTHIKRRGKQVKFTHRQAMKGLLPELVLDRESKANFGNPKIDSQFAAFVRAHAVDDLENYCNFSGLNQLLSVDFASSEGEYWAWEIWGLYATAALIYQQKHLIGINTD